MLGKPHSRRLTGPEVTPYVSIADADAVPGRIALEYEAGAPPRDNCRMELVTRTARKGNG
jgi:hypothetical protein